MIAFAPIFLGVYLGVLNLLTFLVFGWDKQAAALRRPRVPERTLLILAVLGGGPAALLARPVFRHKTASNRSRRGWC